MVKQMETRLALGVGHYHHNDNLENFDDLSYDRLSDISSQHGRSEHSSSIRNGSAGLRNVIGSGRPQSVAARGNNVASILTPNSNNRS